MKEDSRPMAIPTFPARLAWRRNVTPHVLHLGLRRADGVPLDFVAGQFVNIHFDTPDGGTHRSYSIANPPGESDVFEIAMSPVPGGLATETLSALEPGDEIPVSGPYGRFILRDDAPCRYVLVGTGTGITPYRAMLPELRRRMEHDYSVHVLLGVWGRTEALFGEDFVAAAAEHPAFGYTACYSREKLADLADWERQGYVQAAYDNLRLDPDRDIVYLCGNPAMIDESVEILKGRGFDLKRLRREKYVSARPAR